MISRAYRDLNRELHERRPRYGSHGGEWIDLLHSMLENTAWPIGAAPTVLDYGAGKGDLAATHAVYRGVASAAKIVSYDPATFPDVDVLDEAYDFVCCFDVLEHVEPAQLARMLDSLNECCKQTGYLLLVVNTGPSKKILPDGRNSHLIQECGTWWFDTLADHGIFMLVTATEKNDVVVIASRDTQNPVPTCVVQWMRKNLQNVVVW